MAFFVTLLFYLSIFFISFLFISLLFLFIIYYLFVVSFNYFGVLGNFDVLGLGLFGIGIDMCWNFNGCGDFCGGVVIRGLRQVGVGWKWVKGLVLWWFLVVGRG